MIFFNKTAWTIAAVIGLAFGLYMAVTYEEPQKNVGENGCHYQWVDGPYGQTFVCR